MQARLLSNRCAYCGGRGADTLYLDGHPACDSCRTHFREDADPNGSPVSERIELKPGAVTF